MTKPIDLTIRELQTNLPWTIRYSQDFRATPLAHKDFSHALHHVGKAMGRLHELADNADHDRNIADSKTLKDDYGKYVADLVVCALRIANTFPGGVLDLQHLVEERIESKNEVKLPRHYQQLGQLIEDSGLSLKVTPPIADLPQLTAQPTDDIPF